MVEDKRPKRVSPFVTRVEYEQMVREFYGTANHLSARAENQNDRLNRLEKHQEEIAKIVSGVLVFLIVYHTMRVLIAIASPSKEEKEHKCGVS